MVGDKHWKVMIFLTQHFSYAVPINRGKVKNSLSNLFSLKDLNKDLQEKQFIRQQPLLSLLYSKQEPDDLGHNISSEKL